MKQMFGFLLASIGLLAGCSRSEVLSQREFAAEYVKTLKQTHAQLNVAVVADLELKIRTDNGADHTVFLDNAYDSYKQDPKTKDEVIKLFIGTLMEIVGRTSAAIDRNHIIPIIKDKPWLDEMRQMSKERQEKKPLELVFEDLNAELVIVYAEDSPKNIRYLSPEDLKAVQLSPDHLRSLASENLLKLLPEIQRHGDNGYYMFTAGGSYEASLLLFDSIWTNKDLKVDGEVVVAIPSRDVLLVTGSNNTQGIETMKQAVNKLSTNAAYRLTSKLFIYRSGKFVAYE